MKKILLKALKTFIITVIFTTVCMSIGAGGSALMFVAVDRLGNTGAFVMFILLMSAIWTVGSLLYFYIQTRGKDKQ